jgi:hypothetical protein
VINKKKRTPGEKQMPIKCARTSTLDEVDSAESQHDDNGNKQQENNRRSSNNNNFYAVLSKENENLQSELEIARESSALITETDLGIRKAPTETTKIEIETRETTAIDPNIVTEKAGCIRYNATEIVPHYKKRAINDRTKIRGYFHLKTETKIDTGESKGAPSYQKTRETTTTTKNISEPYRKFCTLTHNDLGLGHIN